ncbi:MAG TPA: polysulfide reductase NrfD [Saprospiraceae bacterium]|nr:polysulfide reductase NrfD [Saprospiraceae bacterium]
MRYGFIIDNRKCIGCHACTTACKSEHDVPIGVNRTWVKQVEKGTFPNTRRLFSVMRCNHCTDAPCVEICPVEALYFREDGIVDFDKRRCIGCKSCMQACPYDALYIDPETHTAAKCNYCAHRVDLGLEPACVNVCPEHAIISGDMEDEDSEIFQLLSRQQVKVRKAEKGTQPNLFYIDGDEASLNPSFTEKSDTYLWNAQTRGVGHYAKEAEKLAWSNDDVLKAVMQANGQNSLEGGSVKSIELMLAGAEKARRAYDAPNKGILWGWEVSAYVLTKAISAGVFMVLFMANFFNWGLDSDGALWWTLGTALVFLGLTGAFLVKDLDRPDRFLNVIFRPQWKSWLVRGGYGITFYGGLLTLIAVAAYFNWQTIADFAKIITLLLSVFVAIYTAFLFAQAKGRDFWQSPTLALHMLIHSLMAGAASFLLLAVVDQSSFETGGFLNNFLMIGIGLNLLIMFFEFLTPHMTEDAHRTADMILKGRYSRLFWLGAIGLGNVLPLFLLTFSNQNMTSALAGLFALAGIYLTEKIWVEAPQRIPLS